MTTHDPRLYLFVEDHWIAESTGLTRVLNHPQPLPEPIIGPDLPQTERECAWGNVIREPDGRFRLWYVTMMMGHQGRGAHEMASAGVWGRGADYAFNPRSEADVPETDCMLGRYAESRDGLHWNKPELGLIEFRGSRANNIILTGREAAAETDGALTNFDGYTVVRDEQEPDPARRYKMIAHWESVHYWDNLSATKSLQRPPEVMAKVAAARGKYITYSPDGIRWNQPLTRLAVESSGDRCLVARDHRNNRWWMNNRPPRGYNAAGLATSTDLYNWSATEPHLPREDPNHPDIESLVPFNYGNQDLGFLITQVKGKRVLSYLVSHHDGESWKRIARVPDEPFIPAGPGGSYYSTGAVPLHNEPIIMGDQLYIYFNAFAYQDPPKKWGARSIGAATLRRDGFAGLCPIENNHGSGEFITRPIVISGNRLSANVEIRGATGEVRLALLRPDQTPIPGYGITDCLPIIKDSVRHPVQWRVNPDVSALRGQELLIHVQITGAVVFYALSYGE